MTIKVWLLVMVGGVNNGALGSVQDHHFPTKADCQKVAEVGQDMQPALSAWPKWRCVETNVLVKEK